MAKPHRKKAKAKEEQRSLKNWAKGSRERVLSPHIEAYADATLRGWRHQWDYLRSVCNEFHATFSWRLEDFVEPSLPLPKYDPNAMPEEETLTDEEITLRGQRIALLNERIRRWLRYRVEVLQGASGAQMDPKKNPYAVLLAKLSGVVPPTKARQGWQQFMHESYGAKIQDEVQKRWQQKVEDECLAGDMAPNAPFRAAVAREMFNSMSQSEKDAIKGRAKAEAVKAKGEYEAALEEKPPYSPAQKQKAIDQMAAFLNPIMRGIEQKTGYKFLLVYGGSTPRSNGEISTGYLAWGENKANAPCHFPQWDKDDFKTATMDKWRSWLGTAYTTQDIANNALVTLEDIPYSFHDDLPLSSGEESEEEEAAAVSLRKKSKKRSSKDATSKSGGGRKSRREDGESNSDGGRKGSEENAESDEGEAGASAPKKKRTASEMEDDEEGHDEEEPSIPPRKKARSEPYNPIDPLDPEGPLIPPTDTSNYDQMKAYNTARTQRAVSGLGEEIRQGFVDLLGSGRPPGSARTRNTPGSPPSISGDRGDVASSLTQEARPLTPAATRPSSSPPPPSEISASQEARSRTPAARPSSSPPPPPVVCPTGAPKWFKDAFGGLSPHGLGDRFDELLRAYIRIEEAQKFANPRTKGLSPTFRPEEVSTWVKSGRKKPISIGNTKKFGQNWWKWWIGMQPSWRTISGDRPVQVADDACGDDWSSLQAYGANGFLSVVAALRSWGEAVVSGGGEEERQDWILALGDVIWAVNGLIRV